MGQGLLTVTAVATIGATSPTEYDLTCASTSGVTTGDHVSIELSDGTDALYSVVSISSPVLRVRDDLTEGNVATGSPAEFGSPAAGDAGYGTPLGTLGMTMGPEGARGWRAIVLRNAALVAEAVARKIRTTSGPTELTVGAVADGEFLKRDGSTVVGDSGTSPAHAVEHATGGGDAFTSSHVLEAVVKRLRESGGPTNLTLAGIADGETVRRSGSNLIGYTPASGTVLFDTVQGRLSGHATDPTGLTAGSSDLYYHPHVGRLIALYDGTSAWGYHTIGSGLSFDLSSDNDLDSAGISTSSVYDVFVWDDGGTKKLALKKWTNATTRATALVRQDGVYVLTGDTGKRYVGTIATDSSTEVVNTTGNRKIWNAYNRLAYSDRQVDTVASSYSYASNTFRAAKASTTAGAGYRHEYVVGLADMEPIVGSACRLTRANTSGSAAVMCSAIELDATGSPASDTNTDVVFHSALQMGDDAQVAIERTVSPPAIGEHYLQIVEGILNTPGTGYTVYNDSSSIQMSSFTTRGWA